MRGWDAGWTGGDGKEKQDSPISPISFVRKVDLPSGDLACWQHCQPPPRITHTRGCSKLSPHLKVFQPHRKPYRKEGLGRKTQQLSSAPTSRRLARMFSTSLKSLRSCLFLLLVPSISSSAWKRKYCDSSLNSLFSSTANPQTHKHILRLTWEGFSRMPTGSHEPEPAPGQIWFGRHRVLFNGITCQH